MHRFVFALALVACGDKGVELDSGEETQTPTQTASCDEGPIDEYVAGITKDAEGDASFSVQIQAADPSPPDVGPNTWTLRVTDSSGAEVTEGAVVVTPWMPLHGHGTTPPDYFGVAEEDGSWLVEDVDLFMPGLWELTFEVTDANGASGSALFRFCLEG